MNQIKRLSFRFGNSRRVVLLLLAVFVLNSGYFCPGRVNCDGGITNFKYFVGQPKMQADFFNVFSGNEGFGLKFDGFDAEPNAEIGFYQYQDLIGSPALRRAIRVINQNEAYVDWDKTSTFNPNRYIHFRYNPFDEFWDINNPLWEEPLAAGEYSFTFNQPLLTYDRPVVDIQSFAFGEGFEEMNQRAHQWNTRYLATTPTGTVQSNVPAGVGGELRILTQLVVNNAQDRPQKITYSNRDPVSGGSLPVMINGVTAIIHEFMVPPRTSASFNLDPADSDLQGGWGSVTSEGHVEVATNFITFVTPGGSSPAGGFPAGTVDAQAGISASELNVTHVLSVEKRAGGFDTALAILNPTVATANIDITLNPVDAGGQAAQPGPAGGDPFASAQLVLHPGTQVSRFFGELLAIQVEEFIGTITLDSDTEIAVTTLRTIDGKQASSLPGGTPLPR